MMVRACRREYPTLSHPTSRAGGDPGYRDETAKGWGTGGYVTSGLRHDVRCYNVCGYLVEMRTKLSRV
jgi:hypothetical protein